MLVAINKNGGMTQTKSRNYSFQDKKEDVMKDVTGKCSANQNAIKRDAAKFRQITDLSARLAQM